MLLFAFALFVVCFWNVSLFSLWILLLLEPASAETEALQRQQGQPQPEKEEEKKKEEEEDGAQMPVKSNPYQERLAQAQDRSTIRGEDHSRKKGITKRKKQKEKKKGQRKKAKRTARSEGSAEEEGLAENVTMGEETKEEAVDDGYANDSLDADFSVPWYTSLSVAVFAALCWTLREIIGVGVFRFVPGAAHVARVDPALRLTRMNTIDLYEVVSEIKAKDESYRCVPFK